MPHLEPVDIFDGVSMLLTTSYNVNITQLTLGPVGDKI